MTSMPFISAEPPYPPTSGGRLKSWSLFGFGQASGYSKTCRDVVWHRFYPSDLGIIGIAFKYGITGAIFCIGMAIFLVRRLMRANRLYKSVYGRHNPLIRALLMWSLVMVINIILQPGLAYIQGLTTGSFVIGYTACWYHRVRTEHPVHYRRLMGGTPVPVGNGTGA